MVVDWNHFTPLAALSGGVLIGVSVAAFLLLGGRILGVSGIVGGLFRPDSGDVAWRSAFVIGMMAAPWLFGLFAPLPVIHIDTGTGALIVAGLLVGIGTRFGAGCTSGHGVCGLSRLSPRSFVATACFIAAGFGTVFVVRHLWS